MGNDGPNVAMADTDSSNNNRTASTERFRNCQCFAPPFQTKISGATTNAPTVSASHHVAQSEQKSAKAAAWLRHKLRLPIVALTVVQHSAATTNLRTSLARS